MFEPLDQLWSHQPFADRLVAVPKRGGLVCLEGIGTAQLGREIPSLRRHLHDAGLATIVLDPRAGHESETNLHGLAHQILAALERLGLVSEALLTAASAYEAAHRPSSHLSEASHGRIRHELLGDLLTAASHVVPFVLVAMHIAELNPGDQQGLEFLARNVFSDPIASLAPEMPATHALQAALVVSKVEVPQWHGETIDFTPASSAAFQAYLASAPVLDQLVQATHGDLNKLVDLVAHLPQNTLNLQWVRYTGLEPRVRVLLDVLAVAGEPLTSDVLQRALGLLESSEFFARSVKQATDARLLRRNIAAGSIQLWIDDEDLPATIRDSLAPQTRRRMHEALANAERLGDSEVDHSFVARHFFACHEVDAGLAFLATGVQRLSARGRWEEVLALFVPAEPYRSQWSPALRLARVDALAAMGRFRDALVEADGLAPTPAETFDIKIGGLLMRVSDFDAARARFTSALGTSVDVDARIGLAECDYSMGALETSDTSLAQIVDELADAESPEHLRHLLVARNLRGRIAIYRAAYDAAEALFESNRNLATQYAWEDEIARADANLGVVAMQRRNHAEAIRRLNDALGPNGLRGARPRAYGLVNLATVYQRLEEYGRALEACLEALRSARRADDDVAFGVASHNLATIYHDLGAFDRGHAIVDALRADTSAQTVVQRWSRLVRGYLLFDEHRYLEAMVIFEELSVGEAGLLYQVEARVRLAQAHEAIGQATQARAVLASVDTSHTGDARVIHALVAMTRASLDINETPELSLDLAREALTAFRDLSQRTDAVRASLVMARSLEQLGRDAEARNVLETQLAEVLRRSQQVPDAFQRSYFGKPDHRDLVAALQRLRGDVPAAFLEAPPSSIGAPAPTERTQAWQTRYAAIIGESPRLHQVFRIVDRVASSNATVLVYGESGTGKELVAQAVHDHSDRAAGPFVKVNCAAFVDNLLLSELFGHEKGAFTGAAAQKLGRFELADGGTIFLDEIGDISLTTQVALLRVLQEGTFERVGGTQTLKVNVRVVCATNRNLEEMVQRGEFRLDLYYRLKGVVIDTPALRHRREDVPRLVRHFAKKFADGAVKTFEPDVLQHLAQYSWPGNIRELQNFVRSILLFVEGARVRMEDISDFEDFFISGAFDTSVHIDVTDPGSAPMAAARIAADAAEEHFGNPEDVLVERIVKDGLCLTELKKRLEVEAIKRALLEADGNVTRAAEILQMKRPRLSQIINSMEELADLKANLVG